MDFKTASNALAHLLDLTRKASEEDGVQYYPLIFANLVQNGTPGIIHFQPTAKCWLKIQLLIPFLPYLPPGSYGGPTYFISDLLHNQSSGLMPQSVMISIDTKSTVDVHEQIVKKILAAFTALDGIRRDIEEPFL